MKRTVGFSIIVTGFLLSAFAGAAGAEIYKWVDKDGNVQYTQSPPPDGIKGQEIQPPPPPPEADVEAADQALEKRVESGQKAEDAKTEQAGEKVKTEADAAKQAQRCEQAKARVASYERPRVTVADSAAEDGRRRATEEERLAELEKSQTLVREFCK